MEWFAYLFLCFTFSEFQNIFQTLVFAESLPKKEKKPRLVKSPSQKFLNDGDIIIGALLKSNQQKDETSSVVETFQPPISPPPPPESNKEHEKINVLNFANTTVNYEEMFGDCQYE